MIVIANTTPLIGLAMLNQYNLLQTLFKGIHLPQAVYQEVVIAGNGQVGASETEQGVQERWIHLHQVRSSKLLQSIKTDLDNGEAEAIYLASSLQADLILLDERKARIKAQALNLPIIGTVGVLLLAKQRGVPINIQNELNTLRQQGFHISEQLYQKIVNQPS